MSSKFQIIMGVPDIDRIGGYERQALKLSKALLSQRHIVHVLSNRPAKPIRLDREIWGLPIHRITANDSVGGYSAYQACLTFLNLKKSEHAQTIVHCHAVSDFTFILLAAAQWLRIPTVLKIATQGDINQLQQMRYFDRPIYGGGVRVQQVFEELGAVISLNENLSDELRRCLNLAPRTKSYSNVIDVQQDLIRPGSPELRKLKESIQTSGKHYAIMTNRLEARKQSFPLIQAWTQLPAALRERWNLLVIGDGEQMGIIQEHLRQTGETSVILLGERTDFQDLLHAADLFIFASEREGNPNGLLEAAARGLRVLVTDIEGVGDCLPATMVDCVFSLGRPDELHQAQHRIAEALTKIETQVESKTELRSNIAKMTNELFGSDRLSAAYQRLYSELF